MWIEFGHDIFTGWHFKLRGLQFHFLKWLKNGHPNFTSHLHVCTVLCTTWNALGSWGFVLCILSTLVSSVFPDFPPQLLTTNYIYCPFINSCHDVFIHGVYFSPLQILLILDGAYAYEKGIFPKLNGLYVTSFVFTQREVFFFSAKEKLQSTNQGINMNKIVVE